MKKFILLYFLMFLLLAPQLDAQNASRLVTVLSNEWHLKQIPNQDLLSQSELKILSSLNEKEWYKIPRMPMMIHDVLLYHKVISEPWIANGAEKCKWVSEADWVYVTKFSAGDSKKSYIEFKGLDCNVDVYLNGKLIGSNSSEYLPSQFDCSRIIRKQNTLALHFHSVFTYKNGEIGNVTMFRGKETRRSTHNYDQYITTNPYFSRYGVYDDISLIQTDGNEIKNVSAIASLNSDFSKGFVTISVAGEAEKPIEVKAELFNMQGQLTAEKVIKAIPVKGKIENQLNLELQKPQLWYPRGYGEQPIYKIVISLVIDGKPSKQCEKKIGFRKIGMPKHLQFTVNDKTVKLWGANYEAPNWHTMVHDEERVGTLFKWIVNGHFNSLRIWADTEIPNERFYELTDSLGIMVWNDLPQLFQYWFPESFQTGYQVPKIEVTPIIRKRCFEETKYWINKLKNHPSILIWCGGNEEPLWNNEIFSGNKNGSEWVFKDIAIDLKKYAWQLDSTRIFLPSSPWNEKTEPNNPAEETHGLAHVWYVPGYNYLNFASEDTRVTPPTVNSLKKFMDAKDIWPADYTGQSVNGSNTAFPLTWKKYMNNGSSFQRVGPVEQYYDPIDLASCVQRAGMACSQYYEETIARQRWGRPADSNSEERLCGGYMFWKLNDSWPQIYCAKIDYFLEPTHAYYGIRRSFEPIMLSFEIGNYIWLWAINDSKDPVEGEVVIQLYNMHQNRVYREIEKQVTVLPGKSVVVSRLDEDGIGTFSRANILFAQLKDKSGNIISRTSSLMDLERKITFPSAKLKMQVKGNELEITSDKFARTVVLEGNDKGDTFGWMFEDNYFDLLPGETKIVKILGKHMAGEITAKSWYSKEGTTVGWKRN